MKQLSGKSQRQTTTVKDMNGKPQQLLRWTEYFSTLLNREEPRNPPRSEGSAPELDIDTNIPARADIREAITILKNHIAPGYDELPAELLEATKALSVLFEIIWKEEKIPSDWQK